MICILNQSRALLFLIFCVMHFIFPAVNLLTCNFQHVLGNFSACCCSREASQGHFLFKIHTKSNALNGNNWRWLPLCAAYKRPRCLSHSELLFYYFALFCFILLFYLFFSGCLNSFHLVKSSMTTFPHKAELRGYDASFNYHAYFLMPHFSSSIIFTVWYIQSNKVLTQAM